MKLKKKRKGIALISVLLILTAMMVMTMGFASYTMQDYFVSKTFQQSNTCFYLASAGLDYFVYLLKHNLLVYPYFPYSNAQVIGVNSGSTDYAGKIYVFDRHGTTSATDYLNWNITTDMEFGSADNGGNLYDNNPADGTVDVTKDYPSNSQITSSYAANNFDGKSASYSPGQIINVYSSNGYESIVISRLSIPDDFKVAANLDAGNACGTFKISVSISDNVSSGGNSYLYVTSTGLIRKVPDSDWNADPKTWNISNYQIISRRTITSRFPYYSSNMTFGGTNSLFHLDNGSNSTITIDTWFERFR
ncbi:MAG: hypothetical protein LWY06_10885 [Firmicutes bacterium]|nr:hypothetical protein [Bacillota bacterium]